MKRKYFLLLLFLPLLSGCVDITRDIKLFPNGSGSDKVSFTIDKSVFDTYQTYIAQDQSGKARDQFNLLGNSTLFQNKMTEAIQKISGVSLKDLTVTDKPDGSKAVSIYYTFDDPQALVAAVRQISGPFSNGLNVNYTTIKFFDEGDKLRFKNVLRNATRSFDDSLEQAVFSSLNQSKNVSYSIEFPFEVYTSNGTTSGNTVSWSVPVQSILYDQAELNAEMKREPGIDLPYADKVDKTVEKIDKNKSPLIRVQVYNANQEPVKVGTGIIVGEDLVVTNFYLLNLIEGQGYFSIVLNNDSLAGVDEMRKNDVVPSLDLVYLRFANVEKVKTMRYVPLEEVTAGKKVKILYYPNPLSSTVYSMDASVTQQKKWQNDRVIEIKPTKPLGIEGGAVFNENGEFIGMVTQAYNGEVGKIYVVPGMYIRSTIPKK